MVGDAEGAGVMAGAIKCVCVCMCVCPQTNMVRLCNDHPPFLLLSILNGVVFVCLFRVIFAFSLCS